MLKKLLILIALAFLSSTARAASFEEILGQIQAVYDGAKDVSSEFVQKVTIAALEREVEKSGTAHFKKPGKLRVEYEGDEGRLYVSDGKKLWIYEKGDTQVNVYPVNPDTMPEEALAFLGGLGNLKAQFKVNAVPEKERKKLKLNQGLDWLLLIPKNPLSRLEELLLGFDRSTHLTSEAYLKNESGNLSHYVFKNVRLNTEPAESQFVFERPKGVKEIKN